MLTKSDMHIGLKLSITEPTDGDVFEATVIGLDPYEDKWVVACPDWEFGVSHLEDDDYENMDRRE